MSGFILALNAFLSLRAVQYLLLLFATSLLVLSAYLEVRVYFLKIELKSAKVDLQWVQGALNQQNDAIRLLGEEQRQLQTQKQAKAVEAQKAKATASKYADEIMRLNLGKDCEEITEWGIKQGLSQSVW